MKYTIATVLMGFMVLGCATHKSPINGYESGTVIDDTIIDDGVLIDDNSHYPQEGDRSLFQPVFFAYDSAQVSPDEALKCEQVVKHLHKRKAKGVILEGHADERGSREYNLALGEVRSLAVRDYLINLGVDAVVIQTKSYGEEMPSDMGHDEDAWSQNRRVVFAVY